MKTYNVISYDVWGNLKDGYEVNQAFCTSHYIDVDDTDSDTAIIRKLKVIEYLNPKTRTKFTLDSSTEECIYINRERDSFPICELRLVDENDGE
jgi:hypothetical protein